MNTRTHQRRGLGRGLGALIPSGPRPDEEPDTGSVDDRADAGGSSEGSTPAEEAPSLAPPTPDWIGVPLPGDAATDDGRGAVAEDTTTEPRSADDESTSVEGGHTSGDPGGGIGHSSHDSGPADVVGRPVDEGAGFMGPDVSSFVAVPAPAMPADAELRPVSGAWFAELPVDEIVPNPRQPREVFDEDAIAELVTSITEVGLLQPVVVRPVESGGYELVMGERRWRATRQAGLATIPAIVRDTADDDLLRDALLENLHRSELNALEEAAAYQQLLDDFGCTHDELATRIGRSRPQISNTIRLLKLSAPVQRRVAAGVLSAGHARALLGVDDAALQDRLAVRVVAEGISVRGLEEIVAVAEHGTAARGPARRRPVAPGVEDLAARLSDRLETRVKVDLGRRKGRITVEFASLPDLERIVALIDPGHPTRTRRDESVD